MKGGVARGTLLRYPASILSIRLLQLQKSAFPRLSSFSAQHVIFKSKKNQGSNEFEFGALENLLSAVNDGDKKQDLLQDNPQCQHVTLLT